MATRGYLVIYQNLPKFTKVRKHGWQTAQNVSCTKTPVHFLSNAFGAGKETISAMLDGPKTKKSMKIPPKLLKFTKILVVPIFRIPKITF